MKKNKLIGIMFALLFVLLTNNFGQANYYDGTEGLNGDALKLVLHNKIKGHVSSSYSGVWTILKESDRDPNNPNNVILLYSGRSQSKNSNGGNSNDWNREHVWAKSHGGFGTNRPAGTDAHHLRPTDVTVNSSRGSLDFDMGGTPVSEAPDCKRDGDSWEPRDEVKGDVARMMFYMATRYEGDDTSYDLELVDYTGTSGPKFGKKSVLLRWNREDPVSAFERNRNRVVYKYQKNFNPFIDHPEYADRIYNSDKLFIEEAQQVSGNSVMLIFSKDVKASSAEQISNYEVDRLGTPTSVTANFGGDAKKVILNFNTNFADTFYNVRVSNLTTTTGEVIIPKSIALFMANATTEVDTVAPSKPTNFIAEQNGEAVLLTWDANTESDISHYAIYKGAIPNFAPSQYTLLTTSSTNSYTDTEIADYRVYYKISAIDNNGNESEYSDEASVLVGVNDENNVPTEFSLSQNYPNPFNPSTIIEYSIPLETHGVVLPQNVSLKIYNILGKEVVTLVNEIQNAGNYSVLFNTSATSKKLSSGLYFYTLSVGNFRETKSMLLIK